MKVAIIGGGSTYTPEVMEGLALWQLDGGVDAVSLYDTDEKRLATVGDFSRRMALALNTSLQVETCATFEQAIEGADFVVLQIRVGGQQARHEDILMGLKHGLIGQETTGVGGFAKALRTIPVVLEMARQVRDANPEAWIVNFTNPAGIVTEAICRFATTRCVGLCNVPKEFQMDVARHMRVASDEVELDWVGLNHLGWARRIIIDGQDVLPYLIDSLESDYGPKNIPELEYPDGFLKALGMIPSSYVRYFYAQDQMLKEILKKDKTRAQEVMDIEAELMAYYGDKSNSLKPAALTERGGAWYSRVAVEVMEALCSEKPAKLIVNALNHSALDSLPGDACVEVPSEVSKDGVRPLPVGEVQDSIMGLIWQVKAYERLAIDAAVSEDPGKALLALVNHPLVPSSFVARKVLEDLQTRRLI